MQGGSGHGSPHFVPNHHSSGQDMAALQELPGTAGMCQTLLGFLAPSLSQRWAVVPQF